MAITVSVGILEIFITNHTVNECIDNLDTIQEKISEDKIDEALKICNEAEENYDYIMKNILNFFYNHDNLEEISSNITTAKKHLECKNYEGYFVTQEIIKKQFQALKDEELINIQNII